MDSGPVAAKGVVSVAVFGDAAPLTYSVIRPVAALYTPVSSVQVPVWAGPADSAVANVGVFVSVVDRPKSQFPVPASYCSRNPSSSAECSESAAWYWPVPEAMFAHADTENEAAVFSTGPFVAIVLLVPLKVAAPPDQVTFDAVAMLPVPDASGTAVPEAWFSRHQPTGCPAPTVDSDSEVRFPIGS